ncbi:MAG TPA: hypothetical protein VIM43_03160 [Rugosibacter sp.]
MTENSVALRQGMTVRETQSRLVEMYGEVSPTLIFSVTDAVIG